MAAQSRRANKAPIGNLAIRLVAAPKGFWLLAVATNRILFRIQYFALGSGGHQRQGTVEGSIKGRNFRRFVNLRFDAILVGICDVVLSTDGKETDASEPLLSRPPQLPTWPQVIPTTLMSPEGAITKLTVAKRPNEAAPTGGRFRGTYDLYDLYGASGLYGEYGIYGDYGFYGSGDRDAANRDPRRIREARSAPPAKKDSRAARSGKSSPKANRNQPAPTSSKRRTRKPSTKSKSRRS